MKLPSLTKRQRQILLIMHEEGTVCFFGGTRRFQVFDSKHGVAIRAYQGAAIAKRVAELRKGQAA